MSLAAEAGSEFHIAAVCLKACPDTSSSLKLYRSRWSLCPYGTCSFILIVCLFIVDGTRSSYLSCPSVHSNLTGASESKSMAFARA